MNPLYPICLSTCSKIKEDTEKKNTLFSAGINALYEFTKKKHKITNKLNNIYI